MKTVKFLLSIGTASFSLIALYNSYNFFLNGNSEQCGIALFFSLVSSILFTQISKK